jgi:hypothetical protein
MLPAPTPHDRRTIGLGPWISRARPACEGGSPPEDPVWGAQMRTIDNQEGQP